MRVRGHPSLPPPPSPPSARARARTRRKIITKYRAERRTRSDGRSSGNSPGRCLRRTRRHGHGAHPTLNACSPTSCVYERASEAIRRSSPCDGRLLQPRHRSPLLWSAASKPCTPHAETNTATPLLESGGGPSLRRSRPSPSWSTREHPFIPPSACLCHPRHMPEL